MKTKTIIAFHREKPKYTKLKRLRLDGCLTIGQAADVWGVSPKYLERLEEKTNLSERREKELIRILEDVIRRYHEEEDRIRRVRDLNIEQEFLTPFCPWIKWLLERDFYGKY